MENNNKTIIIIGIIESLIALIPTLFLVWKSWEKKQSSVGLRIIRKKKEIRRTELDSQTKLAKLKIELESLEEEAKFLNRMSKWESGGFEVNDNQKSGGVDNLNDLVSDLKERGTRVVQKGTEQVKQGLDALNALKDKGLGEIDKGLEKVKGVGDQIKGLKDKFLGGSKKE